MLGTVLCARRYKTNQFLRTRSIFCLLFMWQALLGAGELFPSQSYHSCWGLQHQSVNHTISEFVEGTQETLNSMSL